MARAALLAMAFLLPPIAGAATPEDLKQSRAEGRLLVYSNIASYAWAGILEEFNEKYPWIRVETLDLGPGESFERYYSESSVDRPTADVLAVASPDSWIRFMERGQVEPYESPEARSLPAWSRPSPGLYTLSTDPMIIVYNKALLPPDAHPQSLADIARAADKYPALFNKRMTTYDATSHPFAYALHWTYIANRGDAGWKLLDTLGPMTRPEGGGAGMVEKITVGEYSVAYFTSGVTFFRRIEGERRGKLLGWSLPRDGTPIMERGIAITKAATHKAAARLFIDFVLSHEGQVAAGKGGLTPYRPDVRPDEVPYLTYQKIVDTVGPANALLVGYDRRLVDEQAGFIERWKRAYRLK